MKMYIKGSKSYETFFHTDFFDRLQFMFLSFRNLLTKPQSNRSQNSCNFFFFLKSGILNRTFNIKAFKLNLCILKYL